MPGGHKNALGSGQNTSGQAQAHDSQEWMLLNRSKEVQEDLSDTDFKALAKPLLRKLQEVREKGKKKEQNPQDERRKRVTAIVAKELAKRGALEEREGSKNAGDKTTAASTPPKPPASTSPKLSASTSSKPSASTPAAATSTKSGGKTDNIENAGNTENKKKKKKKSKGKKKPDSAPTRSRPHSHESFTRK